MSLVDTRNIERESLFLFAEVLLHSQVAPMRVKVRNLSPRGMMAEIGCRVDAGDWLTVCLPNVGDIRGSVAWVEGSRFGIAFDREIDVGPVMHRDAVTDTAAPRYSRPASVRGILPPDGSSLRRI